MAMLEQHLNEVDAVVNKKRDPVVVAEWKKNGRETVRVVLNRYGGRDVIDIRVWYLNDDGELRPSKKGISMDVAQLPELVKATKSARTIAKKTGLI